MRRGFDLILLVIILDLAVADRRRTVVKHHQARRAQRLAFTGLFQGRDRRGQVVLAQYICKYIAKSLRDADAQARRILAANLPCEILWCARGLRLASSLPQYPQLQKGRFGNRDEARLDQHLLDWPVEFLDDLFHHVQLLRRSFGDYQISFIVDDELRAGEQICNRLFQSRHRRREIIYKSFEFLIFVYSYHWSRCYRRFRDFLRTELGRQHEPFAEPVEARLLHQLLWVFSIHHPHQFVTDLELQVVIARDVPQELSQLHFVQIDAQHLLERRQRLVRHNVYARGLAEVDQRSLQWNVIQMDRYLLLEHFSHPALGAFQIEQRTLLMDGFPVRIRNVRRVLDPLHCIAHVFGRRQAPVFFLQEQALRRRIEY